VSRFILSSFMNLLVPGTGLILLGRTWLGVAVAVCGAWIAPAVIPAGVTLASAGLAAAAWLVAQGLLISRVRFLRDPNLPAELALLRQMAESAIARGDYRAARSALAVALSIDDADVATRVLWARLLTLTASRSRARRAWLGAARLDSNQEFVDEIRDALSRLQAAS
jgi:hypothetical protein